MSKLYKEQIGAITRSIVLGRILQRDHPEIAELYREINLHKIVEELDIKSIYRVTEKVAWSAVQKAIAGYNGSLEHKDYEGLINQEERERLAEKHRHDSAICSYHKRKGAHGRTSKQIRIDGCKGGKISGPKSYEEKKGIFGRTSKKIIEDRLKNIIARGFIPWTDEEVKYAFSLENNPDYQHSNGLHIGKADYRLIAVELNNKYHNSNRVRSARTVGKRLSKHRKCLEDKVD